jgi:hypothetical protein
MIDVKRSVFAGVSCLLLVASVWAIPKATPKARQEATGHQSSAQPQSISGKITAVETNSFTLNVTPSQTSTPGQSLTEQTNTPKSMTFVIDGNTTVDGKLKVSSKADVTYREDNGSNVAISVHVTP